MKFVLSSDAKPRLKWTQELHQRFVNAVERLGGAEKATPKSLMRIMGIDGLTLYHLKSHLQKYRMGKSQQLQTYTQNKEEDYGKKQRSHFTSKNCDGAKEHINESLQITNALQMQMEVQRKLHQQIEVQRHLQLRIEAQGKYLQSVLRKAKETLSQYISCSIEAEQAKAQLSQLLSMVDFECPNSSFSVLTREGSIMSKYERNDNKLLGHNGCSLESSLTSSETSLRNEETRTNYEVYENLNQENGRKMNKSAIGDDYDSDEINHIEISTSKKLRLLENIDLNF
ncbi:myb family transcription factor apl [Phtheirospermum japonicum]|uniref:Myb family transcription factor apl n=1 Tax=Phtheirospermum japonicum TaxID=374723 RepID=A0A830BZC2_9LAMI|nr:myb family transcription factor apl [Phtheirospermum japonicum]